jgi:hypothetical protein
MYDVLLELEVEEAGLLPHGIHHGEHLHWQQLRHLVMRMNFEPSFSSTVGQSWESNMRKKQLEQNATMYNW